MTEPLAPTPSLDDRYRQPDGRILVSGTQALIRLLIEQARRDREAGLNTAGYVSGYRGSPLAGFDREIAKAGPALDGAQIVFQPGLNEDLAATAVWGTQQTGLTRGAKYDGVFAMWYGKGPGVDRSMDAIKHANAAGTAPQGGVLLLMGDDHGAVSSTLAHQSEHDLISAMVPILSPAGIEDYVAMGLAGIAMSRFCGAWVGFKCQTEIVECTASLTLPGPGRFVTPEIALPEGGLSIRWPDAQLDQERRLEHKLRAAQAFARANGLDRISGAGKLGIVSTGKSWRDLIGALRKLGLTPETAGVKLLNLGLIWPLVPETLEHFAEGLEAILVVEEKRPVIEDQIRVLFYGRAGAPQLWGKTTPTGEPLLPATGEIDPAMVAEVLARFLAPAGIRPNLPTAPLAPVAAVPDLPTREPYFCSGCPHSVSTRLPEGSRAIAGIGCSMLALGMDRGGKTFTQMGGEGANWIGHAPFTEEKHVFVHMGDGTYFHSGLLALRAAIAAKVNATYKILFNDAVAMTGGQAHDGELSVPAVVAQVQAEGAREVVVISETPEVWTSLPGGLRALPRDRLEAEERRLRAVEGVTVLIYDQLCAAEKRRRRKRGLHPKPAETVLIHPGVCEGCGDCSVQSNCIAIEPVETDLGTKRQINQSACNADTSCLKGFCPSFVTVSGGTRRKTLAPLPAEIDAPLPEPETGLGTGAFSILMTGVGGTGVITVSAILAQAAHLAGLAVQALDQTGLAQKNGAVMSHLRIARDPAALDAPRIGAGEADTLLGFDVVVAAAPKAIAAIAPGRTRCVIDSHFTPTAGFVRAPTAPLFAALPMASLRRRAGAEGIAEIDASTLAERHFGDTIAANILLAGFAFQRGALPIPLAAIEAAIRLNGAGVAQNLRAFRLGRLAAVQPQICAEPAAAGTDLAALKARHIAHLSAWQSPRYATRYSRLIAKAELRGEAGMVEAVMRAAHQVMSYKDEYEVARLLSAPEFLAGIARDFEGAPRLAFHLAPPFLPGRDARTGRPAKRRFGPWLLPALRLLARMKPLRGTPLDPFGLSAERRAERRLRETVLGRLEALLDRGAPAAEVIATAQSALAVRGFGPVKAARMESCFKALDS
ncbi:indolepyruvate ferredoxin oxidoreductase family protein [Sinirhodobacter huangdaonensis]|uniref:Indolepyruvate ferredoxin oxidoreductase family protein n=1 Tax=Paenirhodobacter huangdaonensis TaxID=2501515 RepID=A0A3S4ML20_9RHOB|nr:indolepyruvate ferredoxin oxidoreductase family protein [Sinirhodobacter huangdaonensis]RWR54585.1 indolepyruvate ferredoxin oxidoreductase family protein [Sinirhodobacter huangdaonensis]